MGKMRDKVSCPLLSLVGHITSDAGSFGYSYTNAGTQLSRLRYPNGETAAWSYDSLGRMTNLAYSTGGSWSYSYDSRDQVAGRVDPATNVYAYRYDDQGRLIEATGFKGTNKVSGYPFVFDFDRVGNRIGQTEGTQQRTLTYNANNQCVLFERPKSTAVRGYVNEASTVHIRSNTATNWVPAVTRYVSQTQVMFEASVTITNWGTNNYVWVKATDFNGNISTSRVRVTSYSSTQWFNYDADGNLLAVSSTKTTNEWDAENRLVKIIYTNGQTRLRYDGFSRLREISEYNASMVLTSLTRIVWRGWLPVGELDSNNKLIRTFTHGVDLSGSIGGAGGIGGLLAIRHTNSVNYLCRHNGRGDVTELRLTNGTVVAAYSFSAYGKTLTQTNVYNQNLRWQTRPVHQRSGYVYMLGRWYNPDTGQFLARDPAGESGDLSTYRYAFGSPLNYLDPNGRAPWLLVGILLLAGAEYAVAPESVVDATNPSYNAGQGAVNMASTAGIMAGTSIALNSVGRVVGKVCVKGARAAKPTIIKKGDLVNRVWDSRWTPGSKYSGPYGGSYSPNGALPINAKTAIETRGLNLPGILNNAQRGGVYTASRDIPATLRTSIGGTEAEIFITDKYRPFLQLIDDSISTIPPGR
jgi:RHS repeat-associated protein